MSDATLHPPPRAASLLPSSASADRPLLLAVATIVALACVAAIAARATWSASAAWTADLTGAMTVQVTPEPGEDGPTLARTAAGLVANVPGVTRARALSADELNELMAPWLGANPLPEDAPLPGLVDVRVDPIAPATPDALAQALEDAGLDALVDDHATWARDLERAVGAVRAVALSVLGLLIAAAAAVTVFATSASLAARRNVVELLHLVGARDAFIAGEFTRRFAMLGVKAGLAGAVAAGLAALFYQAVGASGSETFLPQFRLSVWDLAIIAMTPASAAAVAGLTARRTVLGALRELY